MQFIKVRLDVAKEFFDNLLLFDSENYDGHFV